MLDPVLGAAREKSYTASGGKLGHLERSTTGKSSPGYKFGFQGQEKDDEVFGATGTSMTAEFWQYDTRTGRRWNLDPVPQVSISDYAVFSLNPITNVDPLGNSATKYEDKNGKVLGNTNDGNNSTVTIADDHLAEFSSEFSKAEGNNQQDGLMNNESWIRRFGDKMTVGSEDKAAPWAAQAMGYDANVLIPAAAGLVGTVLEEDASLILKKAARYDGFRAPYEPLKFPTRNVSVRTPFNNRFELPKTTLGKIGTGLKVGGYALGVYQAFDLYNQKQQGLIGGSTYYLEQGSNVFGTFGGLYGAAWSVGWESGRYIMNRPAIKEWKNDTWLPWREEHLGY